MKAPFAYFGGKSRIAADLVAMMPAHRVYVEPFFGSGAVFFAKPRVVHEFINDISGNVVTFLRVLRESPDELAHVCDLTPHARDEFARATLDDDDLDDLERARRFWVRINQSFGKVNNDSTGWSNTVARNQSVPRTIRSRIGRFADCAHRLADTTIENSDAAELIARVVKGPETLVYVDPPYLGSSRVLRKGSAGDYEHDMAEPDEHRRLATALHETPGMVMLSGYPTDLYDELYEDWRYTDINVISSSSNAVKSTRGSRIERIWCNFPAMERLAL